MCPSLKIAGVFKSFVLEIKSMILSMRNKLCLLAVNWEVGRVPHLIFSFFFFFSKIPLPGSN